jgi:acyl carrier protein
VAVNNSFVSSHTGLSKTTFSYNPFKPRKLDMDIKKTVYDFIVENFLFGDSTGLEDSTSFLEDGIIDSTGVLELVSFIEEIFDITIEDEELIPENLDSINNVAAFLQKKTG